MGTGLTRSYTYRGLQISIQARQEEPRGKWAVFVAVGEACGATLYESNRHGNDFASMALAHLAGSTLGEEFVDEWIDGNATGT
ncbi:hypothetical protein PAN31117_05276 [Pandoraea anapnoica]|uniref:Uncharacterized protein n=1 Tax=Pandoraea anapnoica TaxID=2508301 RepID=A0A5E5ATE1_9BURK|nr:hypothetical protein PIN31009_05456 [Pandoraea iniqua]VVE75885.1 hypothetical protein PAN31117_05276 [Pandoraea anapnoica]